MDEMVINKWRQRRDWSRHEIGHRRAYYNALCAFPKLRSAFKTPDPEPEIENCETKHL